MDAGGELVEQRGPGGRSGRGGARGDVAHAVQHQRAEQDRREDAGDLVAYAHQRDPPRRAVDRPEDADVRIDRRLQHRHARADHEQAAQCARIPSPGAELAEDEGAGSHHPQAQRHAFLHAGTGEDRRGRQCPHEVGQVEHERDQEGADQVQVEGQLHEGDQGAVDPGEPAQDEEQGADDQDRDERVAAAGRRGFDAAHAVAPRNAWKVPVPPDRRAVRVPRRCVRGPAFVRRVRV